MQSSCIPGTTASMSTGAGDLAAAHVLTIHSFRMIRTGQLLHTTLHHAAALMDTMRVCGVVDGSAVVSSRGQGFTISVHSSFVWPVMLETSDLALHCSCKRVPRRLA